MRTYTVVALAASMLLSSCQFYDLVFGPTSAHTTEAPLVLPSPAPPSIESPTSSTLTLSWQADGAATSYTIYCATAPTGPYSKLAAATSTSYTASGLSPSTTINGPFGIYYFEVTASDSAGPSQPSPPASGVTSSTSIGAPTGLAVTSVTANTVSLSWKVPSYGTPVGYDLYRYTSRAWPDPPNTSPVKLIALEPSTTTSYTDTRLSPGTTYYYAVQAVDSSSDVGFSVVLPATTSP